MFTRALAAVLVFAAACPATAAVQHAPAAAHATSAKWVVDKGASRLGFSAAMAGKPFAGAFRRWDAQITFDPARLAAAQVTVVVDIASGATGDATRDEALPTADWFSAKAYPRAVFRSRQIRAAGPNHYVAQGDLTIRNVARSVALPFELRISGDTAQMAGTLTLDRSVFGVGQGQWRTAETVPYKVQVNTRIVARRAR